MSHSAADTKSVKVPDRTLRRSKAVAALQGKKVSAWITEVLEAHLTRFGVPDSFGTLANHAPGDGSPATSARGGDEAVNGDSA